jgi:hypothetical protein
MAVIENLSLANTFGEWVNITNDVVDSVNDLYENNFTKTSGTLFLNEPTTGLSVSNNSLFNGLVQVSASGSIVSFGLIEGKDSLVLSNTTANKVVLTANGIVELIGPNVSLRVSNNAIIFGRLNVDSIVANTITVKNFNSDYLNAAFSAANSAASFANGAFLTSNNSFNVANVAFAQANNAFNVSNVVFDSANSAASFANGAFTKANTTNDLVYIVYAYANTGYTQANTAASFANGAFGQANSAASFANGAFGQANSAASFANGAFGQANSAASFANGAFTRANTTNDLAYLIYAYANTGYAQANSAASFANGAFAKANLAFPSAGGTLTGDITGANATFQNISATGNFTISGATVYNSDVFTLNSAQVVNINGTFSTYRPQAVGGVTANAAIRWNDSALVRSWQIRDVLNADSSTAYANIVTSNLISSTTRSGIVQLTDSISSTSTTTAATARVVKVASDQANSAFALANTLVFSSGSFDRANSAYDQANSAASFANGAFARANSAASFANGAFVTANSAASFANGAFSLANTKYNSSGGTISGDVSVTGNLTVNGTTTYIYSKTVDINDSLIHLANNNTSSDVVDIGFYGTYNTGGFNRYTGLFRKAADKYYLVQALTNDPSQNTVTFTNLNRSTLDANFTGGTVSGLSAAIPVVDGGTGTTTSTGIGSVVLRTGPELISPSMSGMPTAPTAAAGNNSTMVATTAFVNTANTNLRNYTDNLVSTANTNLRLYTDAKIMANAASANAVITTANTSMKAYVDANVSQAFNRANSAYAFTNTAIYSITANTNGGLFANGTQGVTQTGNVLISISNTHITNAVTANTTMGLQVASLGVGTAPTVGTVTIGSGANTIVLTPTTTNSAGGIALNMAGNAVFGISKTVSSPSAANRIDLQVGGLANVLAGPRWNGLHFTAANPIISNSITGFPRAFTFWEYDAATNPTYLNFNIVTGNSGGASGGANSNMNLGTFEFGNVAIITNATERMRVTRSGGMSFGSSGTAFGTSGQVLTSAGNAPPTWNNSLNGLQANTSSGLIANGVNATTVTGTALLSLATSGVAAGTYGGTTQIPVFTVDSFGRATYAANVAFSGGATITDDTSTNATRYPLFADATSGTLSTVYTGSTGLTFNPSTGTLSAVIFTSLSDENQKTNIKPIQNALNIVENIKGVTFDWKESNLPSAGLLAQDVEKYLPQLIENVDDKKTLNYNGVIGILVEAIKELNEKIKQLENKE